MDDFTPPPLTATLRVRATLLCHDSDGNVIGTVPIDETALIDLTTSDKDGAHGPDDRQRV